MSDRSLIKALGGPRRVAALLGYEPEGGFQRVNNWLKRGIPYKVWVERADVWAMATQQLEAKKALRWERRQIAIPKPRKRATRASA
jgi:hypothetical protein